MHMLDISVLHRWKKYEQLFYSINPNKSVLSEREPEPVK